MVSRKRLFAVVGVVTIILSALAPIGAIATADEEAELSVEATQDENYDATLTVTSNGTPVEGANVTVDANAATTVYDGEGEYVTDANGTVELPAPDEDIALEVTVEYNNSSITEDVVLEASESETDDDELAVNVTQDESFNVTVSVSDNGSAVGGANVTVETLRPFEGYNGTGEYVTDVNGTVDLPAPETEVKVRVRAESGDDVGVEVTTLAANGSADGNATDAKNFGQLLQQFLAELSEGNFTGPRGLLVADFVTSNNPGEGPPGDHPVFGDDGNASDTGGNASDDAERGPPDDRGPPEDRGPGSGDEAGNESDAGDSERGPPEDRGPGSGDEAGNESDAGDSERGPPEDRGPGSGDEAGNESDAGDSERGSDSDDAKDDDEADENQDDAGDENQDEKGEENEDGETDEDEKGDENEDDRDGEAGGNGNGNAGGNGNGRGP